MFASNGQYVSRQDYQQQQQQQAQQPDIQLRIDELVDESGQVIHGLQDLESQFTHSSTDVTSAFGRSSTDMTIDTTIAPFLVDEPPSPTATFTSYATTLPSTSSKGGFSKSSLSSFLSFKGSGPTSNVSLLRTRGSGSGSTSHLSVPDSKRRSSDDADSVRTATTYVPNPSSSPQQHHHNELRKRPSKFNIKELGISLKRRGSKAHLHQNSQDEPSSPPPPLPTKPVKIDQNSVFNNPVDLPHPLAHLSVGPPVPPKDKPKDKKGAKKGKGKRAGAPELPAKDDPSLYPLDTNLESMEGIIDTSRIAHDALNPNSPGSASASFSASGHQHQYSHSQQQSGSSSALSSPPTFSDPFSPSTDVIPTSAFGPSRISPTTVVPHVNGAIAGASLVNGFAIGSSSSAAAGPGAVKDDPEAPGGEEWETRHDSTRGFRLGG
ncbi:hypothetical protein NP233_g1145 [Leucocoprinus birnbaumii]|uniref:Adenylate cyclase G-alpha binding domain-containing protein n=1 Tax=Leucocoprinus birnbaumii TaxID=56174 RepID=A0AAD5W0H8_9AGAR|nr:hypothetical protein NP233_g1145 [Leucocoprinus birnbaumii]